MKLPPPRICLSALVGGLLLVCAPGSAEAARFNWLTSTGQIGTLTVVEDGSKVDSDWRVDNNGRGPKLREHIETGPNGRPIRWTVEGNSEFGSPVKESFRVEGSKAEWISLNDKGQAEGSSPLYLANNGTPWAAQIYLSALLGAEHNTLQVLPSGTLRLEKIREVEIAAGAGLGSREKLTAFVIWGLDAAPTFLLARKDRLVALLDAGSVLAEEGREKEYPALSALATVLSGEVLEGFSRKLTHRLERPLWVTNVMVFDAEAQKTAGPLNVGIFAKNIVAVGNDVPPPDAMLVDGTGATLLPGLFDSHAHATDWGGPLHIACGVTLGRDPGNDNETQLLRALRVDHGEYIGPQIRNSGVLEGRSSYSASGGFIVSTAEDAVEKVRWYRDHNYWGIKIYNSMNPDFVKPIAAAAHKFGMHVSGHIPAFMTIERAIHDGYDEVHHINQLVLGLIIDPSKEDTRTPFRFTAVGERMADLDLNSEPVHRLIRLMQERGIALDPTLATFSPIFMGRPGQTCAADAPWLDHMPVSVQRARRTMALNIKPEDYARYDASWKKLEAVLLMVHRAGITLVPGTDDMAGFLLHSELESWVKAGISPAAALSSATLGGARFLGMDGQLGRVAVGKLADLYLVRGDPTQDIGALRNGLLTVKDGSLFYPDEIHSSMGITPFISHVNVRNPIP